MAAILDGTTVIEASAFIAAPMAGMTLAQLGAEVIRIDPPGGGVDHDRVPCVASGASLYWSGLNKHKKSVVIDTRNAEGREIAMALMTAPGPERGMVLTNLPARGWLSYEALKAKRDDLIMLAITGNPDGSTAVDYTVNCATGLPFMTGRSSAEPLNNVFPGWDALCALTAALGMITALDTRRRTGEGNYVTLALADVAFAMMGHVGHLAQAELTGESRPALGNEIYGGFGGDFATADGRRVMVVTVTDRQWEALKAATGLERAFGLAGEIVGSDLADNVERYEARHLLTPILARWIGDRDHAAVAETFSAHKVCWGPFQTVGELVRGDPRCSTDNPLFERVEHPGIGACLTPGLPLHFSSIARQSPQPSPRLGQHTDEILGRHLGLDGAALGKLHDRGVVAAPTD